MGTSPVTAGLWRKELALNLGVVYGDGRGPWEPHSAPCPPLPSSDFKAGALGSN
jgi:hypothetical protein